MPARAVPNTIVTFCRKCEAQLRAPAALAGKRGKCARCGAAVRIPLKSEPAPAAVAQPPAAEAKADEKPRQKTVNMPLVCLIAAIAGVLLGLGIYILLPSSSIFLPPAPNVTERDAALASPASTAAPLNDNGNDPSVPSVINLAPKETRPAQRPSSRSTPSAPSPPPPEAGPRPGFGPGPGMRPGPGSGSDPGMRPGSRRGMRPGQESESEPGMGPGQEPGMRPRPRPDMRPGPESGSGPGMGPGRDRRPGQESGSGPGMGPGRDRRPGPESGSGPGMRPGRDRRPGPESGSEPGPGSGRSRDLDPE